MSRKVKAGQPLGASKKLSPSLSPEARENRLISLAMDRAEEQLINGTASSQVIATILRWGTTRERIEKEILEGQRELIEAKTISIKSAQKVEELYANALSAMRRYSGAGGADDD